LHAHFRLYKICTQLPRPLPLFTSVEKCAIGTARNRPASTAHLAIRSHDRNKGNRSHAHSRSRWLSSQTPTEPVRRTRVQVYNNTPTPLNPTSQPPNLTTPTIPPATMSRIMRITLFKLPDQGAVQEAIEKYSALGQSALKVRLSLRVYVFIPPPSLSVCPPIHPIL
jgi:hypothetical protein